MWRDEQTAEYQAAGASCAGAHATARQPWRVIGMSSERRDPLLRSLSQFGIIACAENGDPGAHCPVLCDSLDRPLVRELLVKVSQRNAPLVFCNVSLPQVRARLLHAGADDAVSARVTPCELAARMVVAARRWDRLLGNVSLAGFMFDTGLRHVRWHGQMLPLMPREFDLLLELARHAGSAVSRHALLQSVWQTAFDPGTNSVEVHICKLRRHLAPMQGKVRIETVKGSGYRLVTPEG